MFWYIERDREKFFLNLTKRSIINECKDKIKITQLSIIISHESPCTHLL